MLKSACLSLFIRTRRTTKTNQKDDIGVVKRWRRLLTDRIRSDSFSFLIRFSINSAAKNMGPSVVCFSSLYLRSAGTCKSCMFFCANFLIFFYKKSFKPKHVSLIASNFEHIWNHSTSIPMNFGFSFLEIDAIKKIGIRKKT